MSAVSPPVRSVGAVQLGRHLHGQPAAPEAAAVADRVGDRRRKLPPSRRTRPGRPSRMAAMASHGVEAVASRRGSNPNSAPRRSRKALGGLLEDAHRAVALHVRVAAHGADTAPGADVPRRSSRLTTSWMVATAYAVLGEPHRPARDDALARRHLRELLARRRARRVPLRSRIATSVSSTFRGERLEPVGVAAMNVVGRARSRRSASEATSSALEQRLVAADLRTWR
jgi:hypothetical protein